MILPLQEPYLAEYRHTINVTSADDGSIYYYKITNTSYPVLTLHGRRQYLTVLCGILPDQLDFNAQRYLCAIKFTPLVSYPGRCRTLSWSWDFGDTGTSAYESPWHVYAADGTYDVSMRIRYTCGSCIGDTTLVKPVSFSLPQELLMDSLFKRYYRCSGKGSSGYFYYIFGCMAIAI